MTPAALSARAVARRYGQVTAIADASIDLRPGRIHGLVGENGAGKSTLVRLLAGIEASDAGTIVRADPQRLPAVVPQYPQLADDLPLWQNIAVGAESSWGPFLDSRKTRERIAAVGQRFDIGLDLTSPSGDLSGTETRLAALLAALVREPAIMILDEPTVGLARPDAQRIRQAVLAMRERDVAVLYISHDLQEVARIADEATILRAGVTTATLEAPLSATRLASELFDSRSYHAVSDASAPECVDAPEAAEPIIRFESLFIADRRSGRRAGPISCGSYAGRITLMTGVREAGIEVIERYLSGEAEATTGSLSIAGHRLGSHISPAALRSLGVAWVPSDRVDRAATLAGTVEDNAILAVRDRLHSRGFMNSRGTRAHARRVMGRFDVRTSADTMLGTLSGGMIQKLILARELEQSPSVCIVAEPTAGLDLRSRQMLMGSLRALATGGSAVLILSSDVGDLLDTVDEVLVLYDGQVTAHLPPNQPERIARAFAGLSNGEGCP